MHRALALYSGGLDSLLSIILIKEQNIDVIGIKFLTGFVYPLKEEDFNYAKTFGFKIMEYDLREKFISLLKKPNHGFGKNLNPCIDCKILMLQESKRLLDELKASFVVTGEVVSQRPMSQKKPLLLHIDKKASLTGFVVRPLSAKILPVTKPEEQGILSRELFFDFWGRTRKPQLMLAQKYGIKKIPQPSGGCLLTDPLFCKKLKDLIVHEQLSVENVELLKIGKHFRISETCKAIVGRDEQENEVLFNNFEGPFIYPLDLKGPVILMRGECSKDEIDIGASLCVYYSKKDNNTVVIKNKDREERKNYNAISNEEIVKYRI